jgi:DeoR/GlpR family transcriptional regulator of sugar metabolism
MSLITAERRAKIVDELSHHQMVKVAELSDSLGVSEVSIRRDLQHLEKLGILQRVHGGAVSLSRDTYVDMYSMRINRNREKKESIARVGAEMIADGDRIILDSGTTPWCIARYIKNEVLAIENLTVITASLPVVRELERHPGVNILLLGGVYLPEHKISVGPQTIEQLRDLHADKMFLGTDGLTFTQGLTTANVLEAEVDRAMVRAASEVIVVSDSSKIGVIGLATIMPITEINKLITDQDAPTEFVSDLRDHGVEVVLV